MGKEEEGRGLHTHTQKCNPLVMFKLDAYSGCAEVGAWGAATVNMLLIHPLWSQLPVVTGEGIIYTLES